MMQELIDRKATLEKMCELCGYKCKKFEKAMRSTHPDFVAVTCNNYNFLAERPTIEPEVWHGEWRECWHTDTVCASICTNCGKAATQARVIVGQELMTNVRYPLCPNCGARMGVTDTNVGGKGGAEDDT